MRSFSADLVAQIDKELQKNSRQELFMKLKFMVGKTGRKLRFAKKNSMKVIAKKRKILAMKVAAAEKVGATKVGASKAGDSKAGATKVGASEVADEEVEEKEEDGEKVHN